MTISETDRMTVREKPDHSVLIGKNPTALDLILIIKKWEKESAPVSFVTIVGENSRGTHFEVIDRKNGKEIIGGLEKLDVLTELPGEIIIHQSPKA